MTTQAELIDFVLDNYQGIGSGQNAAPEDAAKVAKYIPGVLADLAGRDVLYVSDGDSVPDAAVHWVAAIISQVPGLRRHFGEPQSTPTVEYSIAMLRQQKSSQPSATQRGSYF